MPDCGDFGVFKVPLRTGTEASFSLQGSQEDQAKGLDHFHRY